MANTEREVSIPRGQVTAVHRGTNLMYTGPDGAGIVHVDAHGAVRLPMVADAEYGDSWWMIETGNAPVYRGQDWQAGEEIEFEGWIKGAGGQWERAS